MKKFNNKFLTKHYQGILFDFDGVLVQSMEDNFKAWQSVTAEYGLTIKKEDYFPFEGMTSKDVVLYLFQHYDCEVPDLEKIVKQKDNYYLNSHQFKPYAGVIPLIDTLVKNRVPIGIVTSGNKRRILKSVPQSFLSKFNTYVTGDMISKGKPSPEPYLMGCKNLNLTPYQCIVVENAPLGIQAAKAAKIFCIAICSTLEGSYLQEADAVIPSFEELRNLEVMNDLLENSLN